MKFVIRNKTGVKSFDDVVKIYDNRGILFYLKENRKGILHFNLPRGIYSSSNNLMKAKLVNYEFFKLPKPNKVKPLPKNFKIVYKNNPHKCSVDNIRHIIYFDTSFKMSPLPIKDYIKFHEVAHYFYSGEGNKSEISCDLFAMNKMIEVGYNLSQIRWAQTGTLSDSQTSLERKEKVDNQLNKFNNGSRR